MHQATAHRYAATVEWTGGDRAGGWDYESYDRSYTVQVPGKPALKGSADAAFRGDPHRHNPEDLFLAAVAGCHMLAYLALCARRGVQVLEYRDEAHGTLELHAGRGGRFEEIVLRPMVTIAAGGDVSLAEQLHRDAHGRCFIASSVRVPILCEPVIREAEASGDPARGGA